uniref:Coenzyme Q-binding protein COQ10 START domain-containing protein n=1 Tax=Noctiluca scintillans TaxID=2966 RepID=A0A7S0ZYB4_NOCSC|mmetsp:Transcript_23527/g.61903  ORF Transcript_23527/g.61903 Transcript_23527/m.61903 type:complete len:667 (+) Transcript_23527:163-2163(+)
MRNAAKVFLEGVQVARHVSRLGLHPLERVAVRTARATEDAAFWFLKRKPVENALGRQRTEQIHDAYRSLKDVGTSGIAAFSHEAFFAGLQQGAEAATRGLRGVGVTARVVGPLDEHWDTLKVLKDLRSQSSEVHGAGLRLTPKRFVHFMREAERRKKRSRHKDPVEAYVGGLLASGRVSSIGPLMVETKLYVDMARLVCFAFDRALVEVNGTELWGHKLRVKSKVTTLANEAMLSSFTQNSRTSRVTSVNQTHVEAVVDQMMKDEKDENAVSEVFAGVQRQLLVNCSLIVLQLVEDLTSDQHMQVHLLGHALTVQLKPMSLDQVLQDCAEGAKHDDITVNSKAIEELVEAILADSEVQLIFVPDILEAEVYRFVFHRMVSLAQRILGRLQIRLFGVIVRLELLPEPDADDEGGLNVVSVSPYQLQQCLHNVESERRRIVHELHIRQEMQAEASDPDPTGSHAGHSELPHEFESLAAQDRLSRSLSIHRTVNMPIELAFRMVSNFDEYPLWMPFCTSAKTLPSAGAGAPLQCVVGFGLETGTMLGVVGDDVRYRVILSKPQRPTDSENSSMRTARVVADTTDGFAYGKRLVYDWRFTETAHGGTDVQLDMFFQAKSVLFLPLWDSMQAMITGVMMRKFNERAAVLMAQSGSGERVVSPAAPGHHSRG